MRPDKFLDAFDGDDIRSHCNHAARIKWLFVDSTKASKDAEKDLLDDRF